MQVLKVELEGIATSFRYPHFMWGKHPSFPMPPPATIYGHICSTMGDWVNPKDLEFGYIFNCQAIALDIEHCHTLAPKGGPFSYKGQQYQRNLAGNINPLQREFLFRPYLTLYLNKPEWFDNFRVPRYPVALGRSQDLATYTRIALVELEAAEEAYYEHTLLPWSWRTRTAKGITFMMPRFVDPQQVRQSYFERYIVLTDREAHLLAYETEPISHWVDPEAPLYQGKKRGVVFHRFVE